MQYISLHHATLNFITLDHITLNCSMFLQVSVFSFTYSKVFLERKTTSRNIIICEVILNKIGWRCITLHCVALHCSILHIA